ncbi:MAG: hypothetical protein A2Z25_07910 [Planctomycetes bacterium RBG_16_55_9]|nr:MAG: hypothetical protein A2Z25_07910 [Planctomycetes bacterium RBG_16_55_9]
MADERFILKDRNSAAEAIRHLGEEDLRFLNRLIVERLKLIAQARSTALMSRFNIGDRVGFQAPSGQWKSGVIQRLHKKTVSILTDEGHRWNVSPGFLSPAGHVPERRGEG